MINYSTYIENHYICMREQFDWIKSSKRIVLLEYIFYEDTRV